MGDVIIDIDIDITLQKLADFYGYSLPNLKEQLWDSHIWHKHEKGLTSDIDLVNYLNQTFSVSKKTLTLKQFYSIWNALLIKIPQERLVLLQKLKHSHALYLLSNTNLAHIKHVNLMLETQNHSAPLEHYFDRCYYSYHIHMRKPDAEIYEYVLADARLNPSETIFFDDNVHNIKAAQAIGIHSIQIIPTQLSITDCIKL